MALQLFALFFSLRICFSINTFSDLNERIVNGIPSNASSFPYIASISIAFGNGALFPRCGGSILRKEYPAIILTAAHCITDQNGEKYKLSVDLYRNDVYPEHSGDSGHYTQWKSIYTTYHTSFNATTFDNDIGLIFLDANLTTYHQYKEVIIPNNITYNNSCCADKDTLTIIGYGYNKHDGMATDSLEYSTVLFMNRTECNIALSQWYIIEYNYTNLTLNGSYWTFATENQICAIGNDTDACQGDSGGPLMKYNTNQQIGIISTGFGCNQHIPGIYTNLGIYYDWIYQEIFKYNVMTTMDIESTDLGILNGTENADDGNDDGDMDDQNLQLVIGCSVALFVLCVGVIVCMIHKKTQKKTEKYNRMNEEVFGNDKGKRRKKEEKEGALNTISVSTNAQIEMNNAKLMTNADDVCVR